MYGVFFTGCADFREIFRNPLPIALPTGVMVGVAAKKRPGYCVPPPAAATL
jgi:hypothetical protein